MKIYYNDGTGEKELLKQAPPPVNAEVEKTTTPVFKVKPLSPHISSPSPLSNKKYIITVEETTSSTLEIMAESAQEALEMALEQYRNGEFIADEVEIYDIQMIATSEDGEEETEWTNVLAY